MAVALICQFVQLIDGSNKVAKVTIVDETGKSLLNKHVKVIEQEVRDYLTQIHGIKAADLSNGNDIVHIRREVSSILYDKILVGFDVNSHLKALNVSNSVPRETIDLKATKYFRQTMEIQVENYNWRQLSHLAENCLGRMIHINLQDSVEDARVCMALYTKFKSELSQNYLIETCATEK